LISKKVWFFKTFLEFLFLFFQVWGCVAPESSYAFLPLLLPFILYKNKHSTTYADTPPRNRLSPRYINMTTTSIQYFETKKNTGATAETCPKRKEMTAMAK
jgi:hypothetical protein